ncbi:MAG: hypothetical protein JWO83_3573 [Caulobacteraceae bacterium]|nr:hypothetical protein [Caulobacteraceae bacterium]
MSTPDGSALRDDAKIFTEYEGDHSARRHRLQRILAMALLVVFCFFFGSAFTLFGPYLIMMFLVPLVVLGLVVIWALPDTQAPPLRVMAISTFTLYLTLVLWPNYLAIDLPGLPWITMVRLSEAPLLLSLLISLSQSQAFRSQLYAVLQATPLVWKLLLGFACVQFLTIPFSHQPVGSLQVVVDDQITCTAVYFAAAYVFLKPGRVEFFVTSIVVVLMVLGLIAIPEFRHGHVIWAEHIPSFLKINDPIVQAILQGGMRAYTGVYRVQATFSTSLGFGEFVALAAPFVLYFVILDERWPVRVAAALSIPFVVYVALLTGSRSAILGCLVASMLWLLSWGVLRWKRDKHSLLGAVVTFGFPMIGALVLAATMFIGRLHRAVWGGGETTFSTQARQDQWRTGFPLIVHNPIGHGAAQSGVTLGYRMASGELSIDSYFLSILLDYGVLGFILFFGMFALGIYYGANSIWRSPKLTEPQKMILPLTISLANFVMVKTVFAQADIHPLVFMMLGILSACVYRSATMEPSANPGIATLATSRTPK